MIAEGIQDTDRFMLGPLAQPVTCAGEFTTVSVGDNLVSSRVSVSGKQASHLSLVNLPYNRRPAHLAPLPNRMTSTVAMQIIRSRTRLWFLK